MSSLSPQPTAPSARGFGLSDGLLVATAIHLALLLAVILTTPTSWLREATPPRLPLELHLAVVEAQPETPSLLSEPATPEPASQARPTRDSTVQPRQGRQVGDGALPVSGVANARKRRTLLDLRRQAGAGSISGEHGRLDEPAEQHSPRASLSVEAAPGPSSRAQQAAAPEPERRSELQRPPRPVAAEPTLASVDMALPAPATTTPSIAAGDPARGDRLGTGAREDEAREGSGRDEGELDSRGGGEGGSGEYAVIKKGKWRKR